MDPVSHTTDIQTIKSGYIKKCVKWEIVRIIITLLWILTAILGSLFIGLTLSWLIKGFPDAVSSATGLGITLLASYFYFKMFFVMYLHYKHRPQAPKELQ